MPAARRLAEACLNDPEQGRVEALQFPEYPANPFLGTDEAALRERGEEETLVLTPAQRALALAALHAVYCRGFEPVLATPAEVPEFDGEGRVTDEYRRAVGWAAITNQVRQLGDWAANWFRSLLRRFEQDLADANQPGQETQPSSLTVQPTSDPCPPLPTARHSADFRDVHWYGAVYYFTPTQAACVKVLWEEWERGTPELGQETILEHPTVEAESKRLSDVFKGHDAWGKLIVPGHTAGAYRLAEPPSRN
jgi:hypothetical protein